MSTLHPYYPPTLSLPHYVPNTTPLPLLLGQFTIALSLVWLAAWFISSPIVRQPGDRFAFMWFVTCASLHCGFEGYYLWKREAIAGDMTIIGQLWKEYSKGDSRYLAGDEVVLALRLILPHTCAHLQFILGPLCLLAARALLLRSPSRHLLQLVVSLTHLQSCTLYFLVDLLNGSQHSRPEPVYYWVYFVAFNAPWIIVPAILVARNWRVLKRAVERTERAEREGKKE